MYLPNISLSLLLPFLPLTFARLEFTNSGTLTGWSFPPKPEHSGTITAVTNVFLTPPSSIKITQTYDKSYTGRYHSEAVYNHGYRIGDRKFYGFSFRLSKDWDFQGSQSYNIAQFIADYGDTKCDDWSPTTMIFLRGTTLYGRVKTGQLLPGKPCASPKENCGGGKNCQRIREFVLLKGVKGDAWTRVELDVKWAADASGWFRAWVDGGEVKGLASEGVPTTFLDDGRELSFRVGLYANGWHDEKKLVGSQGFRQVWIDEVRVGSERSDVKVADMEGQDDTEGKFLVQEL
ncbi:polysaccharide lyase [Dendryphion nanum]|uniref:Polysaccharide lyase n=1 Tax=Dendryphion nanum TaxID=256645 RepID=A0A9P9D1S8_9PLEO|nr:polysaccharide lyase [Dendryphion nanum]